MGLLVETLAYMLVHLFFSEISQQLFDPYQFDVPFEFYISSDVTLSVTTVVWVEKT